MDAKYIIWIILRNMDEQDTIAIVLCNDKATSCIKNESDTGPMDNNQRLLGEIADVKEDVNLQYRVSKHKV